MGHALRRALTHCRGMVQPLWLWSNPYGFGLISTVLVLYDHVPTLMAMAQPLWSWPTPYDYGPAFMDMVEVSRFCSNTFLLQSSLYDYGPTLMSMTQPFGSLSNPQGYGQTFCGRGPTLMVIAQPF